MRRQNRRRQWGPVFLADYPAFAHAHTLRSAAVLQLVGSLKYFDLFYVMMGGAPTRATELMATYMYKKFTEFRIGYASTMQPVCLSCALP